MLQIRQRGRHSFERCLTPAKSRSRTSDVHGRFNRLRHPSGPMMAARNQPMSVSTIVQEYQKQRRILSASQIARDLTAGFFAVWASRCPVDANQPGDGNRSVLIALTFSIPLVHLFVERRGIQGGQSSDRLKHPLEFRGSYLNRTCWRFKQRGIRFAQL